MNFVDGMSKTKRENIIDTSIKKQILTVLKLIIKDYRLRVTNNFDKEMNRGKNNADLAVEVSKLYSVISTEVFKFTTYRIRSVGAKVDISKMKWLVETRSVHSIMHKNPAYLLRKSKSQQEIIFSKKIKMSIFAN
jgi:hypothetical protein